MPTQVSDYTALLSDRSWSGEAVAPTVVTFSFEDMAQAYLSEVGYSAQLIDSFQAFTEAQEDRAREALAAWAAVSGLIFVEVAAGTGEIRFANYDLSYSSSAGAAGFAYYPGRQVYDYNSYQYLPAGDVFIDTGERADMSFGLILHELGHAIGLEHPHEGDVQLVPEYDNGTQTVMSYNRSRDEGMGLLDDDAVRALYGAAAFTPSGDGGIESFAFDAAGRIVTQGWGAAASDILGSALADAVDAGAGDDRVAGFDGDDSLTGGAGNDTLIGGAGDDWFTGGAGDDRMIGGDSYADDLGASGGSDGVDYSAETGDLTIDLATYVGADYIWGRASGGGIGDDEFYGIDNILSGAGHDAVSGSDTDNELRGGAGNDTLNGAGGDDLLSGDDGDDRIEAGIGRDTVLGGAGADVLSGGAGDDLLLGRDGDDVLDGDAGEDQLFAGLGDDLARGGADGDFLFGQAGSDTLDGQGGDDWLAGGLGEDRLMGGAGNDTLSGGAGDDLLLGQAGDDLLIGDAGADRFVLATGHGHDRIADFEAGTAGEAFDVIDLRGTALADFAALGAAAVAEGADLVIATGVGDSLRLSGLGLADLSAEDFLF